MEQNYIQIEMKTGNQDMEGNKPEPIEKCCW
jgi:hypothetical protein